MLRTLIKLFKILTIIMLIMVAIFAVRYKFNNCNKCVFVYEKVKINANEFMNIYVNECIPRMEKFFNISVSDTLNKGGGGEMG